MATPGAIYGARFGPPHILNRLVSNGPTTYAMAALNTGYCARQFARSTKDVKSVKVNWSSVATPGTVELRIETIDAATGKPTGTLYDAAATKSFTPSAGTQTVTFDSLPTAGRTAGTAYAIVLLTTVAGTTQTLRGYMNDAQLSRYPQIVLTAADGTTRSNFAEVASSVPIVTLVLEDDSEEAEGMCEFATTTSNNIFGTAAVAQKLIVPSGITMVPASVEVHLQSVGTPAGDLRMRIFDSGDSVVANSTVTLDKDFAISGLASGGRAALFEFFSSLPSLADGTYRIVFDSAASANSTNCWRLTSCPPLSTALAPANFVLSTCPDVGTPSWTDSATLDQIAVRLWLDSMSAAAGGGGIPASSGLGGVMQQ